MYKKLRETRLKHRYTTQTMANKIGISKSFYSQIETGSRRLTYGMAIKIARVFKRKPDSIFYDDEVEKETEIEE